MYSIMNDIHTLVTSTNRRRGDTEMPTFAKFSRAGKTPLFTYLAALAVEIWAIILAE